MLQAVRVGLLAVVGAGEGEHARLAEGQELRRLGTAGPVAQPAVRVGEEAPAPPLGQVQDLVDRRQPQAGDADDPGGPGDPRWQRPVQRVGVRNVRAPGAVGELRRPARAFGAPRVVVRVPRHQQDLVHGEGLAVGGVHHEPVGVRGDVHHLGVVQPHLDAGAGAQLAHEGAEHVLQRRPVDVALGPVPGGEIEVGVAGLGETPSAPLVEGGPQRGGPQRPGVLHGLVRGEGHLAADPVQVARPGLRRAVGLAGAELPGTFEDPYVQAPVEAQPGDLGRQAFQRVRGPGAAAHEGQPVDGRRRVVRRVHAASPPGVRSRSRGRTRPSTARKRSMSRSSMVPMVESRKNPADSSSWAA